MEKNNQFRTSIGGQALIEGILMRGPEKQAIVVRSPEGLVTRVEELTLVKDKYPILGWPIIRGAVTFLDSMVRGVKALMFSADYYPEDENVQPSKLDKWLEAHIPAEKLQSELVWVSVLLSLGLTLLLFMLLPTFIAGLFHARHAAVHNLIEGAVKIAIFLGYMACTGMMKDIRRTYEYHGAEHKTIACYEAGEELTVENVKKHTRFHPRCGTSFIFITLIVSILVMCIVPIYQVVPRMIVSILLLPVVVGISYEFIRIAGRSNNWLTRALSWPGLQIQRITTREPDASQIECAIAALKPCIPEDMEDDKW